MLNMEDYLDTLISIPDIVDIVVEYIGVCMMCKRQEYPIYKKINDKYDVCVDCIFSFFANNIGIGIEYPKYVEQDKFKCTCCDKSFYIFHTEVTLNRGKHEKEFVKCWCGCLLEVKNYQTELVEHKNNYIHKRCDNIINIFRELDYKREKTMFRLVCEASKQLLIYYEKLNQKETEQLVYYGKLDQKETENKIRKVIVRTMC